MRGLYSCSLGHHRDCSSVADSTLVIESKNRSRAIRHLPIHYKTNAPSAFSGSQVVGFSITSIVIQPLFDSEIHFGLKMTVLQLGSERILQPSGTHHLPARE